MEKDPRPAVRPRCDRCRRPRSTCLCARVVPVGHTTRVLILQHPLEVAHAKGTGHLLHRSLRHSRIEVGEAFDDTALHHWLGGDGAVLLYPDDSAAAAASQPVSPPTCLVVLDATWRKSRRMLFANPRLQALPRLTLPSPPVSRYVTRKAHAPHQRSTLEATLLALAQVDGVNPSHETLLASLDAEQRAWAARSGRGT